VEPRVGDVGGRGDLSKSREGLRDDGGSHSFLEILHTLTPSSLLSYEELSQVGSNDDRMVLGQEVSQDEWIEEELIRAVYEEGGNGGEDKGRREEVLVRERRRVEIRK